MTDQEKKRRKELTNDNNKLMTKLIQLTEKAKTAEERNKLATSEEYQQLIVD